METTSIGGRHLCLRPLLDDDFEVIFKWRSSISDLHLWLHRQDILSFPQFINDFNGFLRNVVHTLMIIETASSRRPAGMIYSYQADYLNGYTYLCTFLDAQYRHSFYGAEASLLFTDYLFSSFPFRKLYAEVYEHNLPSLRNIIKSGWVEEGRLKNHRWRLGGYKDMFIYALYREDFYGKFSRLLSSLKQDAVCGMAEVPVTEGPLLAPLKKQECHIPVDIRT